MTTATLQWNYALAKAELRIANVLKRGQGKAMGQLNKARAAYQRALSGKPPVPRYDNTIPIEIEGIPASVHITHYEPGLPAKLHGHPDTWEPEEPMELEYIICDSKGYEAPWLAAKANSDDAERQILDWIGDDEVWL